MCCPFKIRIVIFVKNRKSAFGGNLLLEMEPSTIISRNLFNDIGNCVKKAYHEINEWMDRRIIRREREREMEEYIDRLLKAS